jgi:hypothetical protein
MKVINCQSSEMECKVCGYRHHANVLLMDGTFKLLTQSLKIALAEAI